MKSTRVVVAILAALASAGVLIAAAYASAASRSLPVASAVIATSAEPHPEDDFFLGPAPSDFSPKVSADEAVAAAGKQEDIQNATSIQPTLATLTLPDFQPVDSETDKPIGPPVVQDVPVWVVTVDGICAASSATRLNLDQEDGSVPSFDPCFYREAKIMVNATTGAVMLEATFRGPSANASNSVP